MSAMDSVVNTAPASGKGGIEWAPLTRFLMARLAYPLAGIGVLLALWWLGGWVIANTPGTESFAGFAPGPTFARLGELLSSGEVWIAVVPSLERIGLGLLWAVLIGVPAGVAIGLFAALREVSHVPFQFLRMISPLAWMPVAVLAFDTWDAAIVFLVAVAAVWPVLFSSAQGVRRIDPLWFKVARNLGADGLQMLRRIIFPAIAQDIFAGIRLAVGVAWIVLVPAEYLGVTSGLGYAINDARDTLEYDTLAAVVVVIGVIGFVLDGVCVTLIRRFSWHEEA
ncbi:MAG: ABC transporter permease [Chromatiaceae bacterium]|nr:ABC transporter permease [Chromatiaceae bacterium]MCP5438778.1 ABC transporter permease [Chromatiaceae bacterium]HPE80049.1 ABC transporter permease [Gammaproteobacteria bacterium]